MKHQTQLKANTTTSTPTPETTAYAAPGSQSAELRLLPISEVMHRTSLSRSLLYSLVQQRKFPPPVKIGATSRWPSNQIDAWLHELLKQAEEAQ
jgi:prophage regulatory protein